MFFLPPPAREQAGPGRAGPERAGPDVPRGATEVTVGRYRAWLVPSGHEPALVIEGDGRDLVISASGLPRSALVSLVSAGLSAA